MRAARPNIKDSESVRAYALSLKTIVSPDATDVSELYDHETVLSKLSGYKETTRKNILNAAVVVLKEESRCAAMQVCKPCNLVGGTL